MLQIEDDIYHAAMAGGVLCTKGSWFLAEGGAGKEMFFRTTFASAPSAEIVEAIKRFAKALRLAFALV
jgi:aromatic amino acid aminotransferase I